MAAGRSAARSRSCLRRQGHEVANSRGPESLGELVVGRAGDNAHAGTVTDAASFGDVVVVALPWRPTTRRRLGRLDGKIVIDTGNYYSACDGEIDVLESDETTSTELLGESLPERGSSRPSTP